MAPPSPPRPSTTDHLKKWGNFQSCAHSRASSTISRPSSRGLSTRPRAQPSERELLGANATMHNEHGIATNTRASHRGATVHAYTDWQHLPA